MCVHEIFLYATDFLIILFKYPIIQVTRSHSYFTDNAIIYYFTQLPFLYPPTIMSTPAKLYEEEAKYKAIPTIYT